MSEAHICARARVELACLLAEVAAAVIQAETPCELAWCCEIAMGIVDEIKIFERG